MADGLCTWDDSSVLLGVLAIRVAARLRWGTDIFSHRCVAGPQRCIFLARVDESLNELGGHVLQQPVIEDGWEVLRDRLPFEKVEVLRCDDARDAARQFHRGLPQSRRRSSSLHRA